ncbi:unnamed protein product [Cuscuta europaea]|nr:unnamed protein product [Cuscuta europaea]
MERGRASVDMSNLNRNRKKEIARNHPISCKYKGRPGSSSQSRDDFETDYQRRDADAMTDHQLAQLLEKQDPHFYQQQDIPEVEDEVEDDDAEEGDPETAEDEGHGSPDDEEVLEDEGGSSQLGNKAKSLIMENNFKKRKDPQTEKWYATCNH